MNWGFRCGSRTFMRTCHISDWIVVRGVDFKEGKKELNLNDSDLGKFAILGPQG